MNMSELKSTLKEVIPDDFTDRLLNTIGLELRRSRASSMLPVAFAFAGGLVVGGLAALMFAPKSGLELRSDIEDKMSGLKSKATDYIKSKKGGKERETESSAGAGDNGTLGSFT